MAKRKTYADAMADVTSAIERYQQKIKEVGDDFVAESDYQRRISKLKVAQKEIAKDQERQKAEEQMAQMQAQGMMPQQGMQPSMPPPNMMPQQPAPPMMPPQGMSPQGMPPMMAEGGEFNASDYIDDPSLGSQVAQFIPDIVNYATIGSMQAPGDLPMMDYRPMQTDLSAVYNPAQAGLRDDVAASRVAASRNFMNPQQAAITNALTGSTAAASRAQLTADQLGKEFELRDMASRTAYDTREQNKQRQYMNDMTQYQFDIDKKKAKSRAIQDAVGKAYMMQTDANQRDLDRAKLDVQAQAYDQGVYQRLLQRLFNQDGTLNNPFEQ